MTHKEYQSAGISVQGDITPSSEESRSPKRGFEVARED